MVVRVLKTQHLFLFYNPFHGLVWLSCCISYWNFLILARVPEAVRNLIWYTIIIFDKMYEIPSASYWCLWTIKWWQNWVWRRTWGTSLILASRLCSSLRILTITVLGSTTVLAGETIGSSSCLSLHYRVTSLLSSVLHWYICSTTKTIQKIWLFRILLCNSNIINYKLKANNGTLANFLNTFFKLLFKFDSLQYIFYQYRTSTKTTV